jgi:hypothetical protein
VKFEIKVSGFLIFSFEVILVGQLRVLAAGLEGQDQEEKRK